MSTLIRCALRSGILLEDSAAAIDVAGEVHVRRVKARGLALESRTLGWALRSAQAAGLEDIHVEVGASFLAQLLSVEERCVETARILGNVRQMLTHHPCTLVVARANPDLHQELDRLPLHEGSWDLSAADAAWVAEHGASVVYTDGSCSQGMVGAWGWYRDPHSYAAGPVEHAAGPLTAERRAIAEALAAHPGPVLILSDHDKVMASFDAILSAMEVVDPLDAAPHPAPWRVSHVKGHAQCAGNLRADRLAQDALAARVAALASDGELAELHEASAQLVTERLWDRQEFRRQRSRWCTQRRRELIAERHPRWAEMSLPERKHAGGIAHQQAMYEYHQLAGVS